MAALAGASALIVKFEGVASRYPQIIQRATEYDLEGYRASLRNRVCFMDLGQGPTQYADECVDKGAQPLWVLWGDSGAAAAYTGLRHLSERSRQFRLAQFTASSCPPMVGYESKNPDCKSNNQWVIDKIGQLVPDTVIMAGIWGRYDKSSLPATIKLIHNAGVRRVIILGPTPAWKDTPSRIVFNLWNSDPLHRIPGERLDYLKYGAGHGEGSDGGEDTQTEFSEQSLRSLAEQFGATYISIADKMCNEQGCLMRESAASGDAFYLDIVHLTPRGSDYAIRAIATELGVTDR